MPACSDEGETISAFVSDSLEDFIASLRLIYLHLLVLFSALFLAANVINLSLFSQAVSCIGSNVASSEWQAGTWVRKSVQAD